LTGLTVDVTMLKSTRGERYDLTSPHGLEKMLTEGLQLDLPHNDRVSTHPLVLYFQDFNTLFSMYKEEWNIMKKPVLVFNFFIPTSGWNEIDEFGRYSTNWKLREQQVDFLLSYFEHYESFKDYLLVIGFCDESPMLTELIEQIYDCMNLYNIPKDRVYLMGHNFLGQKDINTFAATRKEQPIKYVTRWHMTGHMDFQKVERLVTRLPGNKYLYEDKTQWDHVRPHKLSFLNRRPSQARAAMLWFMFIHDIVNRDTISAFPPLRFFNSGTSDEHYHDTITIEYMGHSLQKFQPNLLHTLNPENLKRFRKIMRVGQSIPGDFPYIGDTESQNIPSESQYYVWVTCETVSDFDHPNLFITEKVLKPIVHGHALIVYSQKHFLQRFKKLGYHTLGHEFGINETYDDIDDNRVRMQHVMAEVERINKMPIEELHERWNAAKPKIIENQKRIWQTLTNIHGSYTSNLVKHIAQELGKDYSRVEITNYNVNRELTLYKNFGDLTIIEDN